MYEKDTLCVHSTRCPKPACGSITTPIFQAATFVHDGVGVEPEYSYSRLQNPTRAALEARVAELENGVDAIAFSSGMAAETALMNIFESSGHIIAGDDLYGGSLRLFRHISALSGLRFDFTDTTDPENVRKKLQPDTKAVYLETPSNPTMQVSDIAAVAEIAHSAGALLIVDNTFLSPLFQHPLELGADIVVHSGTKYLGGHNDALAGFLVTKTPELAEKLRFYAKTVGACLAPFDCFLLERGIKTLAVRLEKQAASAESIAHWLRRRPEVRKVYYIGFPDHPGFEVTKRQCSGFGGMLSLEVDTPETARKILREVKLFQYAESLGGVDSLITYPMLQTHADVPEEERLKRGINDRFLRISVGIENAADLIEDLRSAIEK
ncbi:MAG: PLP-dependent aspartate aminotransferase family protein [Thermoguttaceae bacterium]|nr:PLP-dependent aspartate aminotransferase family protein [Thermoguttaceae bacterium]